MGKSSILIVTDVVDAHADYMISFLRDRGHEPVRLNSSDVSARATLAGRLDGDAWAGTIALHDSGRSIELAALTSIWWRKPNAFGLSDTLTDQQREFAIEESDHAIRGLLSALDCYWVSHPENIRRAGFKLDQLRRAALLGFEVPRTLITTDPDAVRKFHADCGGNIVYKVLTDPYLAARKQAERGWAEPPPRRFVATTPITEQALVGIDSVRAVPCQFQEYVRKSTELRVTVIGDEIFAAELLTQEHEETVVDSRGFHIDVTYRRTDLPDDVAERCLRLVRSYGLNFGAIDLIRTPDGRLVFLEINPNGQFLYVQVRVPELRMDEALAACLLRGANA